MVERPVRIGPTSTLPGSNQGGTPLDAMSLRRQFAVAGLLASQGESA